MFELNKAKEDLPRAHQQRDPPTTRPTNNATHQQRDQICSGAYQSLNCLAVKAQFEEAQRRKRDAEANVTSSGDDFNRNARASESGNGSVGDQQQLR